MLTFRQLAQSDVNSVPINEILPVNSRNVTISIIVNGISTFILSKNTIAQLSQLYHRRDKNSTIYVSIVMHVLSQK